MPARPLPVVCTPLLKAKPWGGQKLAQLFGKPLPPDQLIGESWELVSLPDNESTVANGPLSGATLSQLVGDWGDDLLGGAPLVDGRFPLLIKFLDAQQHLSVQVHPKPAPDDPEGWAPGIKHEAWYVLHAQPDAKMFIGLKDGVTVADVAQKANTPKFADLLNAWPVERGQCFYLPSGTMHALGAGTVVAEVQTPSDITYRIYDWDRVGLDGKPRDLHIEQSLANTRYDVQTAEIRQPTQQIKGSVTAGTRVAACQRFTIDHCQLSDATDRAVPEGQMLIWMILAGVGQFASPAGVCSFKAGDTVLLPAAREALRLVTSGPCEWLEVRIPS